MPDRPALRGADRDAGTSAALARKRLAPKYTARIRLCGGPTQGKAWIPFAHFIRMLRVYKAIRRDRQTGRETRGGENAAEGSRWGREGGGKGEREADRGPVRLRGGEDAEKGILRTAVCFGSSSKLLIGVSSFKAYSNFEKCGPTSPIYKGGN